MILGGFYPGDARLSLPRVVRCAHVFCRRTLTEADAIQCPHGVWYCDAELAEDVCPECAPPAVSLHYPESA